MAPVANPILSGQVVALHRQRQQTVVPKLVVVVEVLVHEAEQPLGDQLPHRALDALLAPAVLETARQPPRQARRPVGFAQQRHAALSRPP